MTLYDRVADLPVHIDDVALEICEAETSSDFTRTTTLITLTGRDESGSGEDVTYTNEAHYDLVDNATLDWFPGDYTIDSFSTTLTQHSLFPTDPPERDVFTNYRQWGFESAALDLALTQADTNLGAHLNREYDPVRFVVSTRLGEPPTADRVDLWLSIDPTLEFKLDTTMDWTPALITELTETDAVRILDFKGQYKGTEVDEPPDPDVYDHVITAFPEVVIEDPAITDDTQPLIEPEYDRVSWDAPITSVDTIKSRPGPPQWLNIKPSRFGTINELFDAIEYCETNNITMYGGGQFELATGRSHLHTLASLFYATSPNDVAPRGYNTPTPGSNVPPSPLTLDSIPTGLAWPVTSP